MLAGCSVGTMAAPIAAATPPTYVYVQYDGEPELWHEHFKVIQVGHTAPHDTDWVIPTPDADMYVETLAAPPHLGVRWGDAGHHLPAGLAAWPASRSTGSLVLLVWASSVAFRTRPLSWSRRSGSIAV